MSEYFDPWAATVEEAIAVQRTHPVNRPQTGPLFQWQAAAEIKAARDRCETGDGYAVMWCIHLCAWHDLVMPDWLATDFLRRFRKVQFGDVRSWDEAFGAPHKKKVNRAAARRRMSAAARLQEALVTVLRRSPQNVAIDRLLWAEVGALIGESAGQTEKLYQQNIRQGGGLWLKAEVLREMHAGVDQLAAEANHGKSRSRS